MKTCRNALGIAFFAALYTSHAYAAELTLSMAKKIVERASQHATSKNWKVSIAIVNEEGSLIYFERGEGTYVGSIVSSQQKATSSNAFQRPTSAFVEAVKSGRMGLLGGKDILAIEGGVPIQLNGKHIGAIGVSGAKAIEDEEVAYAGLKALSLK